MHLNLKLASAIFYQIFFSDRMIALQKLRKMFFISSKKLFLFSRYSDFCISVFSSFSPVSHCFRGWSKINLKVYDVINCLNKNLIIHFVWYIEKEERYYIKTLAIDRVLNNLCKKYLSIYMEKSCRKCAPKSSPRSFLILLNNPKQPMHAKNYF